MGGGGGIAASEPRALRAGERLLASTTLEPCATKRCRVYGAQQLEAGPGLQSPDWRELHAWTYTSGAEWIPWSKERSPQEAAAFVIEETFPAPDAFAGPSGAGAGIASRRRHTLAPDVQPSFSRARSPGPRSRFPLLRRQRTRRTAGAKRRRSGVNPGVSCDKTALPQAVAFERRSAT